MQLKCDFISVSFILITSIISHPSTSALPLTPDSTSILLPSTTQVRNSSSDSIPSTSKLNLPTPAVAYTPRNSLINNLIKKEVSLALLLIFHF